MIFFLIRVGDHLGKVFVNPSLILLVTTEEDVKSSYQKMAKEMQLIETCMLLWMEWIGKSSVDKGIADFKKRWAALNSALSSPPEIKLQCAFIWQLFLQIQVRQHRSIALAHHVSNSVLAERFGLQESDGQIAVFQNHFCMELVCCILSDKQFSPTEAGQYLASQTGVFLRNEQGNYDSDLMSSLQEVDDIARASAECTPESHKRLGNVLQKVDSADDNCLGLLRAFRRNPILGKPLLENARCMLDRQAASMAWYQGFATMCDKQRPVVDSTDFNSVFPVLQTCDVIAAGLCFSI